MHLGKLKTLFTVVGLTTALATPATAAPVKIRVSNFGPSTTSGARALEKFAERIKAESKGELILEFYHGGTLASGRGSLAAVRDGIADASVIVDQYTPRELVDMITISELFLLGTDGLAMAGAVNQTVLVDCKQCRDSYRQHKVVPLAFYSTMTYGLMCNKPVTSRAEMKGLRVRAVGPLGVWTAAMGATPVNTDAAEGYEAIQRGNIDCVAGDLTWLKGYSYWDVAKYATELNLGTYHGALLLGVNQNVWNNLGAANRKLMIKHLPLLVADTMRNSAGEKDEILATAVSKHGVKMIKPAPDLVAATEAHRGGERVRAVKLAAGRGVKEPGEIVSTFFRNVEAWSALPAVKNRDFNAFEAELRKRAFDPAALD